MSVHRRACAAAALAAFVGLNLISNSWATIILDLVPRADSTGVKVVSPALVRITEADAVVNFDVFIRLQGTNDLTSDEGFQFFQGGFSTPGALKGNLSATLNPEFATGAASPGTPLDFDGDGDLDIVGPTTGSVPGWWYPRAGLIVAGTDFNIGTMTWTPQGTPDGATPIDFAPRVRSGPGVWRVDGQNRVSIGVVSGGVIDVFVAPSVTLESAVPEPSAAVLTLASAGLLAWRRRPKSL